MGCNESSGPVTKVGTAEIEMPTYYRNPVTDSRERISDLSEDGYCRKFLAMHYLATRPSTVNLDSFPVATFDKENWELEEQENQFVLVKKSTDTPLDELVLDNDRGVQANASTGVVDTVPGDCNE